MESLDERRMLATFTVDTLLDEADGNFFLPAIFHSVKLLGKRIKLLLPRYDSILAALSGTLRLLSAN